jgi:hypothetical protein
LRFLTEELVPGDVPAEGEQRCDDDADDDPAPLVIPVHGIDEHGLSSL